MNIPTSQVKSKKRVGTLHSKPVVELQTSGGLYLLVCSEKGNEVNILGSGSHRSIARYIAEKKNPDLVITELSKSDHLELDSYIRILPKYEELTNQLNELLKNDKQG
jgi:hypothetical protein